MAFFPDNCSVAEIIPMHKNGDLNNPSKYGPISLLTCFSKTIKKLIFICNIIDKNSFSSLANTDLMKNVYTANAINDVVIPNAFEYTITTIIQNNFLEFKESL